VTSDLGAGDEADLAAMLNDASRGDAGHMLDVALWMFDTGLLDAFDAVTCADFATPRDAAGFAQLAEDISVGAPDFGAIVAYQSFDCAYWPVSSSRVPRDVAADGAPPSLVIAATGDPFTPYEWGQALVDQLSSAVLLTRDGNGHTSLENFCISQLADRYLLTLATPEPGTTCT
jgi:pimeloyl-ACP methyl ester carboxylesterase